LNVDSGQESFDDNSPEQQIVSALHIHHVLAQSLTTHDFVKAKHILFVFENLTCNNTVNVLSGDVVRNITAQLVEVVRQGQGKKLKAKEEDEFIGEACMTLAMFNRGDDAVAPALIREFVWSETFNVLVGYAVGAATLLKDEGFDEYSNSSGHNAALAVVTWFVHVFEVRDENNMPLVDAIARVCRVEFGLVELLCGILIKFSETDEWMKQSLEDELFKKTLQGVSEVCKFVRGGGKSQPLDVESSVSVDVVDQIRDSLLRVKDVMVRIGTMYYALRNVRIALGEVE
jgi:hypothetical protein